MRQRLIHWLFRHGKNCKHCCLWCEYFSICSWDTVGRKERKEKCRYFTRNTWRDADRKRRAVSAKMRSKRQLGIISPSLYGIVAAGGKGEEEAKRAGRVQQESRTVFMLQKAVKQGALESIVQGI